MTLLVKLTEGIFESQLIPNGFQQLTSANLATAVNLTVPNLSQYALIQCEGDAARWRDDGVAPTANVGIALPADKILWYTGNLLAIKCIRTTTNTVLNVSYYRSPAVT